MSSQWWGTFLVQPIIRCGAPNCSSSSRRAWYAPMWTYARSAKICASTCARCRHCSELLHSKTAPTSRPSQNAPSEPGWDGTLERFRTEYAGVPMVDKREVVSVICEEADGRCVLKQKFDVEPPMMRGTKVPVYSDEVWIREDGQWWIFKK